MTTLLAQAITMVTLASAALTGQVPAYAPTPSGPCPDNGNVTAWKTFNGDNAPGLGAALLPPDYQVGQPTLGYTCNGGTCVRQTVTPARSLWTPAAYLEADPGYGSKSLDHDLRSFAALQSRGQYGDAIDACFAHHLFKAFAGEPVFQTIAANTDVSTATSAAFLQSFWSGIINLADSLEHYPEQVPVFYNFISATEGPCSTILGGYIGASERP